MSPACRLPASPPSNRALFSLSGRHAPVAPLQRLRCVSTITGCHSHRTHACLQARAPSHLQASPACQQRTGVHRMTILAAVEDASRLTARTLEVGVCSVEADAVSAGSSAVYRPWHKELKCCSLDINQQGPERLYLLPSPDIPRFFISQR